MDSPVDRAAHAARIREMLPDLEQRGGDVLAVIVGQLERFVLGVERYGPLDLDDGHDWLAEEDEELCDVENYRAIRRMLARRGRATRSAARRSPARARAAIKAAVLSAPVRPPRALDAFVPFEAVAEVAQDDDCEMSVSIEDPKWEGEGPRLAQQRWAKREAK